MLKAKFKCKQKIDDQDNAVSDCDSSSSHSSLDEKNRKKYWKKAHKDNEESSPEEIQANHENYLNIQLKNEVRLFRNLLVKENMLEEDCISTRRFW